MMNSITLNDVQSELSDIYVQLSEISTELTGENLLLAGIEKEVLELISKALLPNVNSTLLPAGLSQQNMAIASGSAQGQANTNTFPVYFSNVTNVFLGNEKRDISDSNENGELGKIEEDLQQVINIMNKCGCGGKGEENKNDNYKNSVDIVTDLATGKLIDAFGKMLSPPFEAIAYHDKYINASGIEKFEMDKNSALENVKALNNFWNFMKMPEFLRKPEDRELDILGKNFYVTIPTGETLGTQHTTLTDLVAKYPQIKNDKNFIKEIRRLLDVKGDQNLINKVKGIEFTTEEEKNIYTNFLNSEFAKQNIFINRSLHNNQIDVTKHSTKNHTSNSDNIQYLRQNQRLFHKPHSHSLYNENNLKSVLPKSNTIIHQIGKSGAQVKGKSNDTIINIKIDGLIKQFTINTTTIQASATQIRNIVSNVLLEAVRDSTLTGGM